MAKINIKELKGQIQGHEQEEVRIIRSEVHRKSLKDVNPDNWDKIIVNHYWGAEKDGKFFKDQSTLADKIRGSNKLLTREWCFVNEEVLEEFKKYTDDEITVKRYGNKALSIVTAGIPIDTKIKNLDISYKITSTWYTIAKILYKSKKILDEYEEQLDQKIFRSKEAFKFLHSIIDENNLVDITYKKDSIIKLGEWVNDLVNTDIIVEELGETNINAPRNFQKENAVLKTGIDELQKQLKSKEEKVTQLEEQIRQEQGFKDYSENTKLKLENQQLITAQKTINQLEQELAQEQKQKDIAEEHNQLLQENSKNLVQKSELQAKLIEKLESQLKEENANNQEIDEIRKQLTSATDKLVKSEKELESKREENSKMAKQMEEITQQKEKNEAIIKKLEVIQHSLENSFKRLEDYQKTKEGLNEPLLQPVIWPIMKMNKLANRVTMNTAGLGTAINYVGGGLSTYGFAEIGGGLTLAGSTIESMISKMEDVDKKGQDELIKLEENCQKLKNVYKENFGKGLGLPRRINETISDFLELVNKLQKSINDSDRQEEINKKFEELKEKGKEVEKDLEKVINNLTGSSQSETYTGGLEQEQSITDNKDEVKETDEYETRIEIPTENTPLLRK